MLNVKIILTLSIHLLFNNQYILINRGRRAYYVGEFYACVVFRPTAFYELIPCHHGVVSAGSGVSTVCELVEVELPVCVVIYYRLRMVERRAVLIRHELVVFFLGFKDHSDHRYDMAQAAELYRSYDR